MCCCLSGSVETRPGCYVVWDPWRRIETRPGVVVFVVVWLLNVAGRGDPVTCPGLLCYHRRRAIITNLIYFVVYCVETSPGVTAIRARVILHSNTRRFIIVLSLDLFPVLRDVPPVLYLFNCWGLSCCDPVIYPFIETRPAWVPVLPLHVFKLSGMLGRVLCCVPVLVVCCVSGSIAAGRVSLSRRRRGCCPARPGAASHECRPPCLSGIPAQSLKLSRRRAGRVVYCCA